MSAENRVDHVSLCKRLMAIVPVWPEMLSADILRRRCGQPSTSNIHHALRELRALGKLDRIKDETNVYGYFQRAVA